MRFLKQNLLAAVISAIFMTFLLSSCERNVCDNVTCQHGGSCNNGLCVCPTGYEGPQCQTLSSSRYLGRYAGYITCDNLADVYDTVTITQSTKGLLYVDMDMRSIRPKKLLGVVSSNVSVYMINIINNDSINNPLDTSHYYRTFTVTLQSDKMLSINSYEELENKTDTVIHKCNFLSDHKLSN
ncbi:MAG: hypothetical protein JWQ38_1336 [Flavipsychrobacter sp.]|nr:hypothetical protein [Flavipsychrobacter sp.]